VAAGGAGPGAGAGQAAGALHLGARGAGGVLAAAADGSNSLGDQQVACRVGGKKVASGKGWEGGWGPGCGPGPPGLRRSSGSPPIAGCACSPFGHSVQPSRRSLPSFSSGLAGAQLADVLQRSASSQGAQRLYFSGAPRRVLVSTRMRPPSAAQRLQPEAAWQLMHTCLLLLPSTAGGVGIKQAWALGQAGRNMGCKLTGNPVQERHTSLTCAVVGGSRGRRGRRHW
jgi:hypothetical protein